jgi:hypothetical protein
LFRLSSPENGCWYLRWRRVGPGASGNLLRAGKFLVYTHRIVWRELSVASSGGPIVRKNAATGAAAAACCLVLTASSGSTMPSAAAASAAQMCRPYQYLPVTNRLAENFIIRNDDYGGIRECVINSGTRANFAVEHSSAHSRDREPVAFPYIFLGCSWGLCTTGGGLPARVYALRDPHTGWDISAHAGGTWDATYDIWFDKEPITTGQATGAELMIWLNAHGFGAPGRHTPIVWVDHARWYLQSWITHNSGFKWRLIQFRRFRPTSRAVHLDLGGFIRRMERRHWVRPRYWMLNIDAGFEIWRGGDGLRTNWFTARARGLRDTR